MEVETKICEWITEERKDFVGDSADVYHYKVDEKFIIRLHWHSNRNAYATEILGGKVKVYIKIKDLDAAKLSAVSHYEAIKNLPR